MAPALPLTPESSGATTPVDMSTASKLTEQGIQHALPSSIPGKSTINGHTQAPLDASLLTREACTSPRAVPHPESEETKAQKTCTDHMISARWTEAHGWEAPRLHPYGPLTLMPTASVLHYAVECFEGLKLYRGYDGKLRLFRVGRNCERMRKSAARIALPDFEPRELEKLIVALCARDGRKWLPKERAGGFLYLRPTMIATDPALGVQRPKEALLYVILACFPDMSKSMAVPTAPPAFGGEAEEGVNGARKTAGLKLLASREDTIRAWPGGFGFAKVGANYGPTLMAQGEARAQGFDQVLWLFDKDYVTEAGASNFFVVMREKGSGKPQLITAPLGERIILEGVTRASVLDLARDRLSKDSEDVEAVEVVERRFRMSEIMEASHEGRLVEAFAAGTAFFIAPVGLIRYRQEDIHVPMDGDSGKYARVIKGWLTDIMYGKVSHEWGVVVDEEEEQ